MTQTRLTTKRVVIVKHQRKTSTPSLHDHASVYKLAIFWKLSQSYRPHFELYQTKYLQEGSISSKNIRWAMTVFRVSYRKNIKPVQGFLHKYINNFNV